MKFIYLIKKNNFDTANKFYFNYKFNRFYIFFTKKKYNKKFIFKRNKNKFSHLNKFLNISMRSGKKINLFKNFIIFFSKFIKNVYYNIELDDYDKKNDFIKISYILALRELVKKKNIFYDFNVMLNHLLPQYDSLFNLRLKKLNKRLKKKYKKKYMYMIDYVPFEKRAFLTLKYLNVNSFVLKNFFLSNRYLKLFFLFVVNPSKTIPWQRRDAVYTRIIKKYKKIN